jgi:L-asparaginase II
LIFSVRLADRPPAREKECVLLEPAMSVFSKSDPILVEVLRGAVVESQHRGAACVVDGDGKVVLALGEIEQPVFPRSAVKALQALPLVEGGFADKFGLTADEIALAVSSHSGEPIHAETSARMLAKAGHDASCLECGSHWPMGERAARALAAGGGKPTALHNNCSGKHAGFICLACGLDEDPAGYIQPGHAVQRAIVDVMTEITGAAHTSDQKGIDGCSIPTYAISLNAMALGFARFGSGAGLGRERAKAATRIRMAVAAHPHMVAGTGRFDTRIMQALGARIFTKTGAEGVFCAAMPELGLGVALKCDDGAGRAAEVVMAALAAKFLRLSDAEQGAIAPLLAPSLRNWNGIEVGKLRPAGALG